MFTKTTSTPQIRVLAPGTATEPEPESEDQPCSGLQEAPQRSLAKGSILPCRPGRGGARLRERAGNRHRAGWWISHSPSRFRLSELRGSPTSGPVSRLALYPALKVYSLLIRPAPQRAGGQRHCSTMRKGRFRKQKLPVRDLSGLERSFGAGDPALRPQPRSPGRPDRPRGAPLPGGVPDRRGRWAFLRPATLRPVGPLDRQPRRQNPKPCSRRVGTGGKGVGWPDTPGKSKEQGQQEVPGLPLGPRGAVSTQQTPGHVPPNLPIQTAPKLGNALPPGAESSLEAACHPRPRRQPRAGARRPHLPGARTPAPAAPAGRAGRGRSRRRGAARSPPGIARRPAARPLAAPLRRPWPRPARHAVPGPRRAGPRGLWPWRPGRASTPPRLRAPHWPGCRRWAARLGRDGPAWAALTHGVALLSCLFPPGPGENARFCVRTEHGAARTRSAECSLSVSRGEAGKAAADRIFCSAPSQPPRGLPGSELLTASVAAPRRGPVLRAGHLQGLLRGRPPGGACARCPENAAEQREAGRGVRLEMHEVGKSSLNPGAGGDLDESAWPFPTSRLHRDAREQSGWSRTRSRHVWGAGQSPVPDVWAGSGRAGGCPK